MSSAAQKLASNLDFRSIGRASELKQRLWFILGALVVYRIGTYIPLPGINPSTIAQFFDQQSGGVLDVFNMLSGGALGRMSIFALTIMPYISASIIIQLLGVAIPQIAELKKEGESGRRKINQYTRFGTVFIALIQAYGIAIGLQSVPVPGGGSAVINPGSFFVLSTVVTLVGGTMFLMWLGEQMTSRGIGNGISLLIYSGIVAELPSAIGGMFELGRTGQLHTALILAVIFLVVALITLIVFVERAYRKIIVQYPKRQVGNKLYAGDQSHLPLKINTAGVIPPIFASSILLFPLSIASFNVGSNSVIMDWFHANIGHGKPLYLVLYVAIIIFFSFFYTSIMFNPEETSDNLRKNGGFIAGVRPGKSTAAYLDYILTRLTVLGAAYLALICTLPELIIAKLGISFFLGGTSLLIMVNVTVDMITQIQSHLFAHQYEGLMRKAKLRSSKK